LNGILFASIVPLIPVLIALYFWIKYMVDKNNLLFLYTKKYQSSEKYRQAVSHFMIYNLVFYVLAISSVMGNMLGHWYILYIGIVVIIVALLFLWRYANKDSIKDDHLFSLDLGLVRKIQVEAAEEEEVVELTPEEEEKMREANIETLKKSYVHPHQNKVKKDLIVLES
jgi:membrane protein insertase Oxa1/YidC/SpoIIIJ